MQESQDAENVLRRKSNQLFLKMIILLVLMTLIGVLVGTLLESVLIKIIVSLLMTAAVVFLVNLFIKDIKNIDFKLDKGLDIKEALSNFIEATENVMQHGLGKKIDIQTDDELGKLANTYNYIVDNVDNFIKSIDHISEELSDTSRNLSDTTRRASSSMQEVFATLEGFTATTQQLNSSVEQMTDSAKKVGSLSYTGLEQLGELEGKMNTIVKEIDKTVVRIQELNGVSKTMQGIISSIANIAKQTNLLALNASIEAARAGEYGKGFAVVADEVGKLAGDTQDALEQIRALVDEFAEVTGKTVDIINQNNQEVIIGGEILSKTSSTFNIIVESINQVVGEIEHSSISTNQIALGSQEIAQSTQIQTSEISDIADLAKHLSDMASTLKNTIAENHIGGGNIDLDIQAFDKSISTYTDADVVTFKNLQGLKNKFLIGMIARLEVIKGHEFFIKGVKSVLKKYDKAICVIVGDGSQEKVLKSLVQKEGIQDKVCFLGFRKDIPLLLKALDLVVLTSEKEGLPPRILLEAMAANKPIVATDIVGNQVLIKKDYNGFLVKYNDEAALADRIEYFIKHPDSVGTFGERSRKRLEKLIR